jgi:hypothetical protein
LTTVRAVTPIRMARTRDRPKSMTGQPTGVEGSRRSARRCIQMPTGISSRPKTNSAGTAMKITSPAYGLGNIPSRSAATSVRNPTALTVAMTAPASATGWRKETLHQNL